jgi:DNA primase
VGLIPQSFIDELLARTDIVDVISTRVPLKKAGHEYRACCPFHTEKTPSFWVVPEKQFYHCFGCGAHGTVVRFLMEYDRMLFPEAVEELAGRLGLEVPHEGGADAGAARRTDDPLYELMARVASFYSESLQAHPRALEYVTRRGLDRQTLEQFGIGYAPNAWNEVLRRFGGSDQGRQQLEQLGLIIEREPREDNSKPAGKGERHYDRFRDRIMFPIRDARGRVIAFGGRIVDQGEPKYLNSPETVLFHKGRELYALYETRRARAKLQRLLVVEGYMDAVRLHQSGIPCAVATLGTATTPEHLRRVFRLVNEVVFAFDGDKAGRNAAWRALQQALPEAREGRQIRFLFLPEGHDPDTLVGAEGRERFEHRVETEPLPLSEYLVQQLAAQADLSHADGAAQFAELARPLFAKVPEGVYRELLLKRLAGEVGLEPQRLEARWNEKSPPPSKESLQRSRSAARKGTGAGRRTIIGQAIEALLHYPEIAASVSEAERATLTTCTQPGIEYLRELLDNLQQHPAHIAAQVVERYAERPKLQERLLTMLHAEALLDTDAARTELKAALVKLEEQTAEERLKQLEDKSRSAALASEELVELQQLLARRASPRELAG